jgi:hypothetical protein
VGGLSWVEPCVRGGRSGLGPSGRERRGGGSMGLRPAWVGEKGERERGNWAWGKNEERAAREELKIWQFFREMNFGFEFKRI